MSAARMWNGLWFRPVDARALGLMRVVLGLILFVYLAGMWSEVNLYFSDAGPVDLRSLQEGWVAERWSYLDGYGPFGLHVWLTIALVVSVMLTIGFWTWPSTLLALIACVGMWHRSPIVHGGGDRLLRIWLLYMLIAPAGRALSVDAWLARRRAQRRAGAGSTAEAEGGAVVPVLVLRFIQLQLMILYTQAASTKLGGTGWRDFTALYYGLSNAAVSRFPALFDHLLASDFVQLLCRLGTKTILAWQIAFIPLVLWPLTRRFALLIGVVFHTIVLATFSVGVFSLTSLWAYLAFLDPTWLGDFASRLAAIPQRLFHRRFSPEGPRPGSISTGNPVPALSP